MEKIHGSFVGYNYFELSLCCVHGGNFNKQIHQQFLFLLPQFGNNPFSALGGNAEGSGVQPQRTENREPLPNPWGPPGTAAPTSSTEGEGGTTPTPQSGTTPSISNPLGINASSLGNGTTLF